jgi:hypothetical protein
MSCDGVRAAAADFLLQAASIAAGGVYDEAAKLAMPASGFLFDS